MRGAIIGFVVGIALLQVQPALPDWHILFALAVLALVLYLSGRRTAAPVVKRGCRFAGGALAGIVWAAALAHLALSEELPRE